MSDKVLSWINKYPFHKMKDHNRQCSNASQSIKNLKMLFWLQNWSCRSAIGYVKFFQIRSSLNKINFKLVYGIQDT